MDVVSECSEIDVVNLSTNDHRTVLLLPEDSNNTVEESTKCKNLSRISSDKDVIQLSPEIIGCGGNNTMEPLSQSTEVHVVDLTNAVHLTGSSDIVHLTGGSNLVHLTGGSNLVHLTDNSDTVHLTSSNDLTDRSDVVHLTGSSDEVHLTDNSDMVHLTGSDDLTDRSEVVHLAGSSDLVHLTGNDLVLTDSNDLSDSNDMVHLTNSNDATGSSVQEDMDQLSVTDSNQFFDYNFDTLPRLLVETRNNKEDNYYRGCKWLVCQLC